MKFTTHLEHYSQSTRLFESTSYAANSESKTGFSPSMIPCSKGYIPGSHADSTSLDYNSRSWRDPNLNFELFPLHSPLLRESLLVSFPPLNNMLKFSGYSRSTSGLDCGKEVNSFQFGVFIIMNKHIKELYKKTTY